MNYVPYPAGAGNSVAVPPDKPRSIAVAVKLMYAGAAVEFVYVLLNLSRIPALTRAIAAADGYSTGRAHAMAVHQTLLYVAGGLIGAGLWLWMARASAAGRSWARRTATVLFAADTLGTLLELTDAGHTETILGLLGWLVGLAASICLWRRDASRYFADASRDPAQYADSRYF